MKCSLVCSAAMNDGKSSANFVKEGIKLLQKRSNPVELFVQKRVMIFFSYSHLNVHCLFDSVGLLEKIPTISVIGLCTCHRNVILMDSSTAMRRTNNTKNVAK